MKFNRRLFDVLRVTLINQDDETVYLRLDGKLAGTCASTLEEQCSVYMENNYKTVLLDFTGVSYIDAEGVEMLERVKNERIQIVNCPLYIETLLGNLISRKTKM